MKRREFSTNPLLSSVLIRFWAKVERRGEDECWPWTASRIPDGYGSFKLLTGVAVLAHRVSFFIAYGLWPNTVRHSCDNPPCCNPKHLVAGTQADNVKDRDERERRIIKLTRADAKVIRQRVAAGEFHHDVAGDYKVARTVVTRIVNGDMWKAS